MWAVGLSNKDSDLFDIRLNPPFLYCHRASCSSSFESCYRRSYCTKRSRFTLIEVIIVLVIFGLILGIVVPKVGHISSGIIRSNAIKNIKSSFYMASSIAAASGKPVKLKFNIEQKSIDINRSASTNTSHFEDEFDMPRGSIFDDLKQFYLPESTELDPHSFNDYSDDAFEYSFFPNGEAAGPNISILIEESIVVSIDVDRLTGKPLIKIDEH